MIRGTLQRAGADRIAAHAIFGIVDGDIAVQSNQTVFATHIGRVDRSPIHCRDRGDNDDRAAFALLHELRQGVLTGEIDATVVDIMGVIPNLFR